MALHLLKLAVGAESVEHLREFSEARPKGQCAGSVKITTRMAPKRTDELLSGGSLYWVVKGAVAARQRILRIEPFTDGAGIGRVHIHLKSELIAVRPRPCRPFQGWRYLRADEAPADISKHALDADMPPAMRRDLMELCLI